MVLRHKRTLNQTAEVKLKLYALVSVEPKIGYNELGRRLGIDPHTAKKYRNEWDTLKERVKTKFVEEVEKNAQEKVSIIQTIRKSVSDYFNLNKKEG